MEKTRVEIRYQRGDASADDIQAVADELLSELDDPDSEAAKAARGADLDPRQMADTIVDVTEGAQGAEPVLTAVLIGITISGGSKVVETFWQEVLWPRIKKRLGARALRNREGSRG